MDFKKREPGGLSSEEIDRLYELETQFLHDALEHRKRNLPESLKNRGLLELYQPQPKEDFRTYLNSLISEQRAVVIQRLELGYWGTVAQEQTLARKAAAKRKDNPRADSPDCENDG